MIRLADLISRVEASDQPNFAIEQALHEHFCPDHHQTIRAPAFTYSLDGVINLAATFGFFINSEPRFHIDGERVTFRSHALRPRWDDWRPDDEWFDCAEASHHHQAMSALLALLRALSANHPEGEGGGT